MVEEFGAGGIARYVVDVANLIGPDYEVKIATASGGPAGGIQYDRQVEIWFPVGSRSFVGKVIGGAVGLLKAVVNSRRQDVVWIQLGIRPLFEFLLALVLRVRGIRLVCTIHNRRPHGRADPARSVVRVARACSAVVVHTRELLGWARSLDIQAIHLPFPPPNISHSGPAGIHSRSSLKIPEDFLVLLLFGNLAPYKGADLIVAALARSIARRPDLKIILVVAGRSLAPPDPLDLSRSLGIGDRLRRLPGYLSDGEMADLLGFADAVALPYRRVDTSGAGAVASAHGLPAIASDLPALRDLFDDSALYVAPGSIEELADAVCALPDVVVALRSASPGRRAEPDDYSVLEDLLLELSQNG